MLGVGELELDGGSLESERQQKARTGFWRVVGFGDSGELGMVYHVGGFCLKGTA